MHKIYQTLVPLDSPVALKAAIKTIISTKGKPSFVRLLETRKEEMRTDFKRTVSIVLNMR